MLKFIQQIMDWWWDRPPGDDRHDFVEPPRTLKFEKVTTQLATLANRPTLEEALEIVKEHFHVQSKARGTFEGEMRGRPFTAAPSSEDAKLMQPPNLQDIVRQCRALGAPFLFINLHRETYDVGATHGWCNGSHFGAQIIHELMRCAELNFRQELAKCGEFGAPRKPYSGPAGYMEGDHGREIHQLRPDRSDPR